MSKIESTKLSVKSVFLVGCAPRWLGNIGSVQALDPAGADPDGLASAAREQITRRQEAEELAERETRQAAEQEAAERAQRATEQAIRTPAPADRPHKKSAQGRKVWLWAIGAIVCVAAIVTAAILVVGPSPPTVGKLTYKQLRTGDCLAGSNMPLGNHNPWPATVEAVLCNQSHLAEIFYYSPDYWAASQAFPGNQELANQALAACYKAFSNYVGIPQSKSKLTFQAIWPADWSKGGRSVSCVVWKGTSQHPTPLYGSVKGSRS